MGPGGGHGRRPTSGILLSLLSRTRGYFFFFCYKVRLGVWCRRLLRLVLSPSPLETGHPTPGPDRFPNPGDPLPEERRRGSVGKGWEGVGVKKVDNLSWLVRMELIKNSSLLYLYFVFHRTFTVNDCVCKNNITDNPYDNQRLRAKRNTKLTVSVKPNTPSGENRRRGDPVPDGTLSEIVGMGQERQGRFAGEGNGSKTPEVGRTGQEVGQLSPWKRPTGGTRPKRRPARSYGPGHQSLNDPFCLLWSSSRSRYDPLRGPRVCRVSGVRPDRGPDHTHPRR